MLRLYARYRHLYDVGNHNGCNTTALARELVKPIWAIAREVRRLTLAERRRLSFYDEIYLELAKRQAALIGTLDKALAQAGSAQGLPLVRERR